jgi:uncharacterized protein (DUF1330 family)
MAKGYWIAHITLTDVNFYKEYAAANQAAFKKFGARYVVRGGKAIAGLAGSQFEVASGSARDRYVVLEFDDFETAVACHNSPEYQAAAKIRDKGSKVDLVIIEGYEPPA